jgi:dolichyl-phosphate beta-glucosyltransferase
MKTTLVVPCYNEAKRLDVARFERFIREGKTRVLFANDGSTDATLEVLAPLVEAGAKVFTLEKNSGKAEAVRQGMLRAAADGDTPYIGFWDADLATPLEELARFESFLEDDPTLEMVTGARVKLLGRHIDRRLSRHYIGRAGATAISGVLGLPVYDTQCGAKLFRANERMQRAFASPFLSRWIFDVEIIARYQKEFAAIGRDFRGALYEVPLGTWTDVDGSKVRPRDFARAMLDLWRIHHSYHPRQYRKVK